MSWIDVLWTFTVINCLLPRWAISQERHDFWRNCQPKIGLEPGLVKVLVQDPPSVLLSILVDDSSNNHFFAQQPKQGNKRFNTHVFQLKLLPIYLSILNSPTSSTKYRMFFNHWCLHSLLRLLFGASLSNQEVGLKGLCTLPYLWWSLAQIQFTKHSRLTLEGTAILMQHFHYAYNMPWPSHMQCLCSWDSSHCSFLGMY